MKLSDLTTPCLVLDRPVLRRNLDRMAQRLASHGVPLRPHLKTAKCIEVARLALEGQPGSITVSTLAEAEYFAGQGVTDILYAVGITPQKLDRVARLNAEGARVSVITDDLEVAATIARHPLPPPTLIEIDTGEDRSGLFPEDPRLLEIAVLLGPHLAGVMTHAGHSYGCRSPQAHVQTAEAERAGVMRAAARLRAGGHRAPVVSLGSSPTALHAPCLEGITEVRAGVYMFGDLFQAQIGTHRPDDIAVTLLASVIGRRPDQRRLLIDAGSIALSKDRSTEKAPVDYGFGLMLDEGGRRSYGHAVVGRVYQEHGLVECDPDLPFPDLPIGAKVRIAPNHVCMTAAAHRQYYVVDGGRSVAEIWTRTGGW